MTLFEKKITEKNKIFVKIIHIFYLKNIIIFRIFLLHLNNHTGASGLFTKNILLPLLYCIFSFEGQAYLEHQCKSVKNFTDRCLCY